MSIELLINKYRDLETVSNTGVFIARFLKEMRGQAIPTAVQLGVCDYLLQFPGRAWNGCTVDASTVTIAIPLSETDNEDYTTVAQIHVGDNTLSINDKTIECSQAAVLTALNEIEYAIVVEDIELSTATGCLQWDKFNAELLAEFTLELSDPTSLKLTEVWVHAGSLVNRCGELLIGLEIATKAMGEWPGGKAEIIAIRPDPACPEIVMQVCNDWGEIGVFTNEAVQINTDVLQSITKE